jgi:hypothetical protein
MSGESGFIRQCWRGVIKGIPPVEKVPPGGRRDVVALTLTVIVALLGTGCLLTLVVPGKFQLSKKFLIQNPKSKIQNRLDAP